MSDNSERLTVNNVTSASAGVGFSPSELLVPRFRAPQPDGRVRHWAQIAANGRYLRVVTLEDGETVHNAFFDRNSDEAESLPISSLSLSRT